VLKQKLLSLHPSIIRFEVNKADRVARNNPITMPPANRLAQVPKPSAIEDVWDEVQIEKALKRLDLLHVKVKDPIFNGGARGAAFFFAYALSPYCFQ